jgi:hypothetical protein
MKHFAYKSIVELSSPDGYIRLPKGVGDFTIIYNGIRGTIATHAHGLYTYVQWADGNEGPCDINHLTEVKDERDEDRHQ